MRSLIFKCTLALFLAGLLFPNSATAQNSELIVIGNQQSVPTEMNMIQLKSVMKGEKQRWDDGSKVLIALMKTNTTIGTNTCEKIYNMTSNELNKYFGSR